MVNRLINNDETLAAKEWLEQFVAVGGFVFSDGTIGNRVLGYSDADQADAREMIADITADMRRTIN